MFEQFFDTQSIFLYLLGFITFIATLLDDVLNPHKRTKKYIWYLREFLYTFISIALGVSFCYAFETSQSVCWIVTIIAGLFGSTFIRKFRLAKDELADSAVKGAKTKIEKTIENLSIHGNSDNNDTEMISEEESD